MDTPKKAGNQPVAVDLEADKTYAWCACGLSQHQPFCDGSHKSTTIRPCLFSVKENKNYHLCMCKQTKNPPFCDGTHNKL